MAWLLLALSVTLLAGDPRLNINEAGPDELAASIHGVGPKKAQAIIEFRSRNGPFHKVDDLIHVKGIGPKTLAKNRHKLTVEAKGKQQR